MSLVKNTASSWSWLAVSLHWLTALAVFGLYALGWYMVELDYYDPWYRSAPHWHKSVGLTLVAIVIIRLIYRSLIASPPDLDSHAHWEKMLAKLAHGLLYLLLFVCFISGYLISTADGRGISFFSLFDIPSLISDIDNLEDDAGLIHYWSTNALLALAVLHALAALKHHFIDRDITLLRMFGIERQSNPSVQGDK